MIKKIKKNELLAAMLILTFTLSACSSNSIKKEIVGKWKVTEDETLCDFVDGDLLRINKDNSIENLIDYEEYSVDETEGNHQLVVKGFGETSRFIVNLKDDVLKMYEQDSEEDLFCTLKKVK